MVLVENNNLILSSFLNFQCLAEKCKDTCCHGFSIPLDNPSLNALYAFADLYMPSAITHLKETENGIIIKFQNGICPFLHHNLCTIQSVGSEEFLSYICRMYPRTFVNYGDLSKNSLFLSCEAVAALVLNWKRIDEGFKYASTFDDTLIKQYSFLQKVSAEIVSMHKTVADSAKKLTRKMDITDGILIDIIDKSQPGSCGLSNRELHNLCAYYVWHYYNGNNEEMVKDVCLYMTALDGVCTVGCQSKVEKAAVIHKLSKEIEHSDSNMKTITGFYQKQKGAT